MPMGFQAQRRAMDQEFLIFAGNERGRLRVGVTATQVTSSCRAPSLLSKSTPKHFH